VEEGGGRLPLQRQPAVFEAAHRRGGRDEWRPGTANLTRGGWSAAANLSGGVERSGDLRGEGGDGGSTWRRWSAAGI
jgi:hypothetical protein